VSAAEPSAESPREEPLSFVSGTRLEKSDGRLVLVFAAFLVAYAVIAIRLGMLATFAPPSDGFSGADAHATSRPDITDRNGEILATDIKIASLYAEPKNIIDVDEATELLTAVLPDLNAREVREKLASRKGFVWLRREITPTQQAEIHRLGLPGIGFTQENRRVYPVGRTVAHVLGAVNIDNQGIAGLEKHLDGAGLSALHSFGLARTPESLTPVPLTLDLKVQFALHDELTQALAKFKAKAAAGLVLDVRTGEIRAMVSLPDYDPNDPKEALQPDRINRVTTGVFEMGSTFKAITAAMALDSGKVSLSSTFDARAPIRIGRFAISDYRGKNRILTLPEVLVYSSNIGTAKMALAVGVDEHKSFLRRLGLLSRIKTELPESAEPLVPNPWGEVNTMTVAFGHGLSVSAMHMAAAGAALVNGGYLATPTFFPRDEAGMRAGAKAVLKPQTSEKVRQLLRLNAVKGSATRADIVGYRVGGKTGTAEKVEGGRYSPGKRLTTFLSAFPMDAPEILTFITLDEPQGLTETHGFATSGWNAAPTTGRLIARIAPMLGVMPRFEPALSEAPRLAVRW